MPQRPPPIVVEIFDDVTQLDERKIAYLLAIEPIITKLINAAKSEAERRVFRGQQVTGWAKGEGKRSRVWLSEEVAKQAMNRVGINDPYNHTLLSVAQAEEKIQEQLGDTGLLLLKPAWKYEPGKPKIVPVEPGQEPPPRPSTIQNPPHFDW